MNLLEIKWSLVSENAASITFALGLSIAVLQSKFCFIPVFTYVV